MLFLIPGMRLAILLHPQSPVILIHSNTMMRLAADYQPGHVRLPIIERFRSKIVRFSDEIVMHGT
jgi:hypothetical protein